MVITMRCPFCAEEIRGDASVCRYCGNDLKIPEALATENDELKKQLTQLQQELDELHAEQARRRARRSTSDSSA